ncbi:HEPN domain protein OS=Acinetobacter baumannii 1437282 GN=J537_0900 PE=4 SV=1 [Gemmata massiliana]|uniref:HEPN domain protein n=1 Tax=Gemmata massiliana TaxID=1210884 RepID=A0A6P2CXD1_9BACT|nr:hypothetical protein [Gemmata massiliana]VTR91820.1 HEPN domain protein OS=Acinetobacter baumannii 1437282 GN=J537_0900 PE=4 SV=1 [Gemmata massiliana]
MKTADYLKWYEDLLARFGSIPQLHDSFQGIVTSWYEDRGANAWTAEAASALASVFLPNHPIRQSWDRLSANLQPSMARGGSLEEMAGVFQAAVQQLRDNRLSHLLDAIRAETEDELLDQAATLLGAKHVLAAAIIAGGALETHLRHLVGKAGLTVSGDGSISKYDGAIAKARNDGTATVYSPTDSKLVTGWGGIRNDAAHTPTTFSRSAEEVQRMIDGIREFIARTS